MITQKVIHQIFWCAAYLVCLGRGHVIMTCRETADIACDDLLNRDRAQK